ncbi:MAG: hypothetical protein ACHQK9_07545, partial [Reyranellales bacterium]
AASASAQDALDAGGLTFRDFGVSDNGASFNRNDSLAAGGPNEVSSRVLTIDSANGLARVRFDSIKIEVAVPLGWQATEDWERGVAYSGDRRYRLIVWRVDFAFEGVKDAEHYAATKSGSIRARRPTVQAQARKLPDGTFLIVYQNVRPAQGDSESRVVFDLVMSNPGNAKEGALMTLGVPASEAERGLKLFSLMKSNIKITW